MEEVWKDIPSYEGIYKISNQGLILRLDSNTYKSSKNKRNWYPSVQLWKNNKGKNFNIHRLLALCFIPNPYNHPIINHKDGDKTNYRLDNLEWCDYQHNNVHAFENGLNQGPLGELNGQSILTEAQVREIVSLTNEGVSQNKLSKRFNVSKWCINDIISGRRWGHLNLFINHEKRTKVHKNKPIICTTNGVKYNSATSAAKKFFLFK